MPQKAIKEGPASRRQPAPRERSTQAGRKPGLPTWVIVLLLAAAVGGLAGAYLVLHGS